MRQTARCDRQFPTRGTCGVAREHDNRPEQQRASERHDGDRRGRVSGTYMRLRNTRTAACPAPTLVRQGEAGVTRSERGLASTSARCAARASQRASEVRPRTVGSPVDVLGPDELARRSMRAHGGARRDLLRSSRAPRVRPPAVPSSEEARASTFNKQKSRMTACLHQTCHPSRS